MNSRIGLVQMRTTEDFEANLSFALKMVYQAAGEGLDLVAFPEGFLYLGPSRAGKAQNAFSLQSDLVKRFQDLAAKLNISILLGSIYETVEEDSERFYNTSILIDEHGHQAGVYRKMHLCDINTPQLVNIESKDIKAGNEAVVVEHKIARIGMTICYDLRFPTLFEYLTQQGAELILVPSAFFLQTGMHHWLPLLTARAIENQVYIAAPAQWGCHYGSRISYGKTMLIDPWGTVLACAPEREELISGNINLDSLRDLRARMPISTHKRFEVKLKKNSDLYSISHQ